MTGLTTRMRRLTRAVLKAGAPQYDLTGGPTALVVTLVAMNGNWSVFDVEAL